MRELSSIAFLPVWCGIVIWLLLSVVRYGNLHHHQHRHHQHDDDVDEDDEQVDVDDDEEDNGDGNDERGMMIRNDVRTFP
ncbi:unnamed protein product [Orchesella dallaii]|uniref:Uncharacterized protein n=1 Tax=Orchesella dallaii TaxID=48710 RepID=A0ABP1SAB6_9HEXA